MRDHDPEGYYAALKITHNASQEEIHLAYNYLKGEHARREKSVDIPAVSAAYAVLKNSRTRKAYDAVPSTVSRLHSVPLLLVLVVALVGVLGYVLAPIVMAPYITFEIGDELYWRSTARPLGVVAEYEPGHQFPDGAVEAAYRIKARRDFDQWFPAGDLNRNCKARR